MLLGVPHTEGFPHQFVFIGCMVAIFYSFMIRPQYKRQKEQESFVDNLKKGTAVVTIGGIYGKISGIKEETVTLEVDAKGAKITILKSAISLESTQQRKKEWKIFLYCVTGTLVFWVFRTLDKTYTIELNCSIDFILDSPKWEFTTPPPSYVPLEVTGSGWRLVKYQSRLGGGKVEVPVEKLSRRGSIHKRRLHYFLRKKIKDIQINKVLVEQVDVPIQRKKE